MSSALRGRWTWGHLNVNLPLQRHQAWEACPANRADFPFMPYLNLWLAQHSACENKCSFIFLSFEWLVLRRCGEGLPTPACALCRDARSPTLPWFPSVLLFKHIPPQKTSSPFTWTKLYLVSIALSHFSTVVTKSHLLWPPLVSGQFCFSMTHGMKNWRNREKKRHSYGQSF